MPLFSLKRPRPHSFVLSIYVLVALVGSSSLFLAWSYWSGIHALDDELKEAFEQRRTVSEIILEHRMEMVGPVLEEILEDNLFLDALARRHQKDAQYYLLSATDRSDDLYLDLVLVALPDNRSWIDASSPFFEFNPLLEDVLAQRIPDTGMVYKHPSFPPSLTLLLQSVPVILPDTGRLLGRIIGGIVLDNQLDLMEKLKVKTHANDLALFSGGRLISSNTPLDGEKAKGLSEIYARLTPGRLYNSKGRIAGVLPLRLYGSLTPLEMVISISDTSYRQLKSAYQVKILIMFILAVGLALLSAWIIRRLTHPYLERLQRYSNEITSGNMGAVFKPGMLTEFNQVAQSMETMVQSLAAANQDLVLLQNYLSNIIDSMPSILVGMDPETRVTQWNLGAAKATGIPQEKALGAPLEAVFPRLASKMPLIEKALKTRSVQTLSKHPHILENHIRYEDITIYPLTANGAEGAVIRIDDVTETLLMEERMIQSEKMLSVGGLAAGMAHEINNPLAGMIQTADTLKKRLTLDLPANIDLARELGIEMDAVKQFMVARKVPKMLETIKSTGIRAAEIVSNMLSFARKGDSGMLENSLTDLMDDTLALAENDYDLKKKYDFRQISIVKHYDPDLPKVPCEPGKIKQVFLNILTNGAQAMFASVKDGSSSIRPEFDISIRKRGEMAVVRITDNGPGMDPGITNRIFEPFFTTKPEGEGTGLGLSVSYFIIKENHNGRLSVTSEPGKGACFSISLPFVQPRTSEG